MSLFRFPFGDSRRVEASRASRRLVRRRPSARTSLHRLAVERCESRAMLAAQIVEISSTLPAGAAVGIGSTIPFQVIYDEPVAVLSSPVANVNVVKPGGVQATATFTGVNGGGRILNFSYTVATGDAVPQFDVLLGTPFLVGGTITTVSTGIANDADRTVTTSEPTIVDLQPGLYVDGIVPVTPTVSPTVYVNPTVWQAGDWALQHPDYFAISGTAGTTGLAADEVLTVTVNGATYRATAGSSAGPGNFYVDSTGAWKILVRPVGGQPATIPFSGALAPWSTTNTNSYNVIARLTDNAGNSSTDTTTDEVVVDTIGPKVAKVTSTTTNGTYTFGDPDLTPAGTLDVSVQYSEPVRVMGTPTIAINVTNAVNPGTRVATFSSVDPLDGRIVHFRYVIQPGDSTPAGGSLDYVGATAISVGSGYIEDQAGNAAANTLNAPPGGPPPAQQSIVGSGKSIVVDTTAPTVAAAGVSSTAADGTYYLGGPVVPITVTFSEPVFVDTTGGTPQLFLNSAPGRFASYASGSGTTVLTFNYTVQAGDDTAGLDLNQVSTTALQLNGGRITDLAGNNADLTLSAPSATGSLAANKTIVIAAAPTIQKVSSPDLAGIYMAGDTIRFWVMFSKVVTTVPGPAPTLQVAVPPGAPTAVATFNGKYINGAGAAVTTPSNIMQFEYLVRPGDSTSGTPLNYVAGGLNAGAGIRYVWTPAVALPGFLDADVTTLPAPTNPALDTVPANNIVIAPDTNPPLAPLLAITDTTNDIGNYATDGITKNTTINVTGLETKPNTTWQYRYKLGGSGAFTSWLVGGPISATGTSTFTLPGDVTYGAGAVEVRQADWSGNVGAVATNVAPSWNIDVTAPNPPATATIPETGTPGSGVTNNPTVTVTGLEAGALLQYNKTFNSNTGTVTAGSTWISVAPATGTNAFLGGTAAFTLPPGTYDPSTGTGVVVRQQDLAGNFQTVAPWTQLTTSTGGTVVIIRLDTTVATPTVVLNTDTTPGFAPYAGTPYTTDNYTSNGLVNVSGLEVSNLGATPPVSGIANWQYSTDFGVTWTIGGTTAPTGTFTLPNGSGLPGGTVYAAGAIRVRQTDLAGNVSTAWQNPSVWTVDHTAPAIQTILAAASTYTAGQPVTITVNFGESVYLSSTTAPTSPTLTLNTGATATLVTPVAAGATSLQFSYTVRPGDATSSLQVTAFNLNGALLADKAGNQPAGPLVGAPVTVAPGTVIISAAIQASFSAGSTTASGPLLGTAVATMQIVFNTPVSNFTLASLRLFWSPSRTGTPNRVMALTGATLKQVNATTYTLTLPKAATSAQGAYMLVIDGTLTGIRSTLNPSAAMTTQSRTYFRR